MKHKKYKIRIDRIVAVFIIIAIPIVLLFVLFKHPTEENRKPSSFEVQADSSCVCTSTSISSTTQATSTSLSTATTVTTESIKIKKIESPQCFSSALYSVNNNSYIYSDNINKRVAPASLTKLLTASVALKYVDKSKVFSVGSEQWLVQPDSSLCGIQNGNMLTLEDLITGMLMASGNDAVYTIAVSTAREINPNLYMTDYDAVQYFCGLMNELAFNIGMENSNFVNPDGWDDDEQYTTVYDLIKLTEYTLSIPEIYEIAGTYSKNVTIFSGEFFNWENSNQLLNPYSDYFCESAKGMKTGTTLYAGYSLIAVFQKNEEIYISIVTGCQSDESRYELTLKLQSLT